MWSGLDLVAAAFAWVPLAAGGLYDPEAAAGAPSGTVPPGFLGSLEGHHKRPIYALAFAPEGWLATGSQDHSINVWNLTRVPPARKKPFRHLEGHAAGVTALAFVGRGGAAGRGALVSGGADGELRLWDLHAGQARELARHPKAIFGVSVRPGRLDRGAPELDAAGMPPNRSAVPHGGHTDQGRADEPGELATACWDGVVRVLALQAGARSGELGGHEGGLYSVAYSPLDGSLLASASADRTVRIWDLNRMEMLWALRSHRDHVTTVDWSPSEPLVLASGGWDRRFRLWRIPSQEAARCRAAPRTCSQKLAPHTINRHPQLVWRVAFAPGGELVAACHGAVGQSPTVVIYEVATGRTIRRLGRHRDTPLVVGWSTDGSVLASAGMDRRVLLYDGHSLSNDMPQGDRDDPEEAVQWRRELNAFLNGTENATEAATGSTPSMPHPLAGRMAFM